jgi:hypothetical protein
MSVPAPVEAVEREWLSNYPVYAKDHLKIQLVEGGLAKFTLNPIQWTFHRILEDIRASGRLLRVIVLKARREGLSTYVAGRYFWHTTTTPNRYAFMITHEPDATEFVFGMHKRFYENLAPAWKPATKYNNIRKLEFNKPKGKGLDSAITVATAGKEYAGSSQLIHYLHLSEMSKWPAHTTENLLTSILQCVPDADDSEVVDESTANGIGGKFYERYWAARFKYKVHLDGRGEIAWTCEVDPKTNPSNPYSAVFFPWFAFPAYKMPVVRWEANAGMPFERTKDEQGLVDLHLRGVSETVVNQKLCWRRKVIEEKCQGQVALFNQEYPATDVEAFISSGATVFDTYQILKLMEAAPAPVAKYEILPSTGDCVAKPDGHFWVWEEPRPDRAYVISADVAEGIEIAGSGGQTKYDFSVFDVVDMTTGAQVAQWHGHIDPDLFGRLLCYAGRRYNVAWLAPERNNHGHTVVTTIMNAGYPRIYVEKIPDPPNKPRKRYGWLTTRATKPKAIDQLIAEMRDGTHGIRSKRTFQEMLSFKKDEKGEYGAEEGQHDDCVMSYAINKWVRPTLPATSPRLSRFWKMAPARSESGAVLAPTGRAPRSRPPMAGWAT